ncbi:hypothetical protein DACRYDRAFT_23712 [Dacryopinax primogenitus]|uniref:CENP-V/GFA domain-containing protein n=1 Tax=Dacryopinax primogenitus (strain DJM 731) TaxID=1858805 RepID=M5FVK7_DACPD|nr:uncharacterized protein DACRYDRAFT_23712 [Dacryopinax primogenitus]EJT99644.1 hypothetical protein DACRYDRAFT_23712 [Dacryopinax primogenitus]
MPEEVGPVVEHKDAEGRGPLGRKWKAHLCFCTDCRLSLGHLLPSFISVDNDYITWLEKGTLKTYDSSPEKGTQRLFCGKCGASVGKRLPGRSELDVNLGMLELEGEGEEGGKGEGLAGVLREWTVWEKPRFMAEAGDGRLRDEILSGMKRDGFILD